MSSVSVIETATLTSSPNILSQDTANNDSENGYAFQVSYSDGNEQQYTLYLITQKLQDRSDWIRSLRTGMYLYKVIFIVLYFVLVVNFNLLIFVIQYF